MLDKQKRLIDATNTDQPTQKEITLMDLSILPETKMTAAPYKHVTPNLDEPTGLTNRRKAHCRDCRCEIKAGQGHQWQAMFAFGTPLFYVCDADHAERMAKQLPDERECTCGDDPNREVTVCPVCQAIIDTQSGEAIPWQ